MGGYIQATNTTFRNNVSSVHAYLYDNFLPTPNPKIADNVSFFNNCTFEIDNNYLAEMTFYKHVDLDRVKGIKFSGCDFKMANVPGVSGSNQGIASYGAGFSVTLYCNSNTLPCSDYKPCTFDGFNRGINASNSGTNTNTFSVFKAQFNNNAYGISMNGVNDASVTASTFNIGYNAKDKAVCGKSTSSYGIDIISCHGFAIEENQFNKADGAPSGDYKGIRVKDSHTNYDLIYNNIFNGLSYGNYAEGMNRSSEYDLSGLEFQCNTNTANNTDFIVTDSVADKAKIRTFQGYTNLAAGNKFSGNAQWHFKNDGKQVIDYFYCGACTNETPQFYTPDYVMPILSTQSNGCPSHYGGGGGSTVRSVVLTGAEKVQTEQDYATNLSDYNSVKALYDNLKDGGNTDGLKDEIATSWPTEMWELRANLLGKSPHLSQTVLMEAADKTDVLPESVLFEILSANPDELRNDELLKYLENKDQPLPEYLIDILKQLAGGITYKTILQMDMAKYSAGKTMALYDLIRSDLNDTVSNTTDLRNRLSCLQNMDADEQIVSTYIAEGNYTSAQTLLNMIPELYGLKDEALKEFEDYKGIVNLQIGMAQEGRDMLNLNGTEVAELVSYAENSKGKAKFMAQGILNYGYGYDYCNCPAISDTSAWKSSGPVYNTKLAEKVLSIVASPNPAKTWVAFNYSLPLDAQAAVIEISDMHGRTIATFELNTKMNQKVWDIREVERGLYLYRITTGTQSESGKLIIE